MENDRFVTSISLEKEAKIGEKPRFIAIIYSMKKYVAVLGRQPYISMAELESLFDEVKMLGPELAEFQLADDSPLDLTKRHPDIRRLGGTQKIAEKIEGALTVFLASLPSGKKITLGVSDFSEKASPYRAQGEALKLKRLLVKHGHSVRVVPNKSTALSSATSFHNHLVTETKIELIKRGKDFYRVVAVQNIDAYALRDQVRPARDAKVGMLPPKLAQILINLCGNLATGARLLDPFCGTGVVLQEATLMGYRVQGSDLSERMVEYTEKNLTWLSQDDSARAPYTIAQGDATNYQWTQPIDLVACETYLGQPMSNPPAVIKLKAEKQECGRIILGFLKNLAGQITPGTPAVLAVPAWLRPDGHYERLNLLDEIENLGYNVKSFKNLGQSDLLYHRDNQVVAREIIVLRKK